MKHNELKPCPFCGSSARIVHTDLYLHSHNCAESIRGLYSAQWSVECTYCGVKRSTKITYYAFTNDGTLQIADGEKDGRQAVIDDWNRRANDGT